MSVTHCNTPLYVSMTATHDGVMAHTPCFDARCYVASGSNLG
jgi:hypothetical protein